MTFDILEEISMTWTSTTSCNDKSRYNETKSYKGVNPDNNHENGRLELTFVEVVSISLLKI